MKKEDFDKARELNVEIGEQEAHLKSIEKALQFPHADSPIKIKMQIHAEGPGRFVINYESDNLDDRAAIARFLEMEIEITTKRLGLLKTKFANL